MKKLQKIITSLILCSVSLVAWSQRSAGGFPLPEHLGGAQLRSTSTNEWVEMPPFDRSLLAKQDIQTRVGGIQFAYGFRTELTPQNSGTTTYLPDGTSVWRLKIRSRGALSINLIFSQYQLSEGAQVFIYSPNRETILGAFTHLNNQPSHKLATTPIDGDEVIVEYIEPKGSHSELCIGQVSHGYRSLKDLPSFGIALPCQPDINCKGDEIPDVAQRSVAAMIIDGMLICSGSLINNTSLDKTPYFLSAGHCMEDVFENHASSLNEADLIASTCVFFFNYEAPHCLTKVQGSMEMSIAGASAIIYNREKDLLLLKLNEPLPIDFNTYLPGWNLATQITSAVYGVHHPVGDMKKYCISSNPPTEGSFECCSDFYFAQNSHWIINGWDVGLTEGGSSGSPLFDTNNRIIGALSGGYSDVNCNDIMIDVYYRLNSVWNGRSQKGLSKWLDPIGTGQTQLDGIEPFGSVCNRISNYNKETIYKSTNSNYVAGHNEYAIREYAERFEEGGTIYGVHFIPEAGAYDEADTIWVKIYSGKELPEKEVYKQRVRVTNVQYMGETGFEEFEQYMYTSKDNYVRFDQPVAMDSSFFVVFELPKNPVNPFGLMATKEKADDNNTAFYKSNQEWKSFAENPIHPSASSLLVDVRMTTQKGTDSPVVTSEEKKAHVYPNPTDNDITIDYTEKALYWELFDTQAHLLTTHQPEALEETLTLKAYKTGIYLLKIIYNDHTEYHKIIKQ